MDGTLCLDLLIECGVCDAVDHRRVAEFLVEAACNTETEIAVPARRDGEGSTGRKEALTAEVPVGEAYTVIQGEERRHGIACLEIPRILQIALEAFRIQIVACPQRVDHLQVTSCMRNIVTC